MGSQGHIERYRGIWQSLRVYMDKQVGMYVYICICKYTHIRRERERERIDRERERYE